MILSFEILKKCLPYASDENIRKFVSPLNLACERYEINTPRRQAAFLAQLAHESGSLRYVEEIATGEAYEGRKDLGNTQPGDGVRFKGRGLIQITGRANYEALGHALNYDFIKDPEALEKPGAAALSAGWFWYVRHLNRHADIDGFKIITQKINGGLNGYLDRVQHWERCKAALGVIS
jgi:putative chitinase